MIDLNTNMTLKEAIEVMRNTRVKVSTGNVRDYESAKILLLEAAGYRVEKEPVNKVDIGYALGECPRCGNDVDEIEDDSFCCECGQKLTW